MAKKDRSRDAAMTVIQENIDLLHDHEERKLARRPAAQKIADKITAGIGTITCVVLHAIFFLVWILLNVGALGVKPFDPFPFGLLTMMLSIEAIFLTLFVLISQNRMQMDSDARAELDVQINLLTEHELTRLIRLTDLIADKLEVDKSKDPELADLEADIDAEDVIDEIEKRQKQTSS